METIEKIKLNIQFKKAIYRRRFKKHWLVIRLIETWKVLVEDHYVDDKFNSLVRNYYEYYSPNDRALSGFVDLRVKITKDLVSIKLTTKYPGMFIGKGGRDWDLFKDYIKQQYNREVKIDLKETKYW